MGKAVIRTGNPRHNGADGAYLEKQTKREQKMLVTACEEILNYLRLSGTRINGASYGSEKMYTIDANRLELHRLVATRYMKLAGAPMPFGLEEVANTYAGCRKGNYKVLRDGKPIVKDCHALPLFGDSAVSVASVVYAYWGRNQNLDRRLVKVGYTQQELAKYLRSLGRMYDPQLMASRPGTELEEKAFHADWERFVAEGREWYWVTESMFDLFRREWNLTAQFDALVHEALATSPYHT